MSFKLTGSLIMLAFVAVQGAVVFQDDFSNPANSDSYWPAQKDLQLNFAGGECSVANTNTTFAGLLTHTVNSKPTEFTYSASVTRSSDTITAGLYVNSVSNTIDGFVVQLGKNKSIYVTKFWHGGDSSKIIFSKQSGCVTAQTNNLMISKKSTSFHIYCNNQFIDSFTESNISAVAVGFIVSPKTSAVFDNVILTDAFVPPPDPNASVADNFNDGTLSGWVSFGKQGDVSESDSVLKIKTKTDSIGYLAKDFSTSTSICTLKVEVSHRGGNSNSLYGLFFYGTTSGTIPIAGFGITGSSYYGILLPNQTSIDLTQNSAIKGDAYISGSDTTYKTDTLKIINSSGYYKCYANDVCLDSFNINFPITGVGVFCYGDLTVYFDNFYADKPAVSVTHFIRNRHSTLNLNSFSNGNLLVDPLGRSIPLTNNLNKSKIASGLYLTNKKMANKVLIAR